MLLSIFPSIGGIAHTHSEHATAWAQARLPIPCFGTTHADYFHGPIPLAEVISDEEINGEYEANTGVAIIPVFQTIDPVGVPAALVPHHGPFASDPDPLKAAENAWMLELVARLAYLTVGLNANASFLGKALHDRYFLRKHGKNAYYGQASAKE
jgi:L-ribulose-5-phosphate 4-epimerase